MGKEFGDELGEDYDKMIEILKNLKILDNP